MRVLETERLALRRLDVEQDAAFVLRLLNDPDWLTYIGDRGVRNLEDARHYLREGPVASYARHGHGLYAVEDSTDGALAGICGLLRRDFLDGPDLGFAFLPDFRRRGYAFEASVAVLRHERRELGLERVFAVTSPDNAASIRLLGKLGFRPDGSIRPPGDAEKLVLHVYPADPSP